MSFPCGALLVLVRGRDKLANGVYIPVILCPLWPHFVMYNNVPFYPTHSFCWQLSPKHSALYHTSHNGWSI